MTGRTQALLALGTLAGAFAICLLVPSAGTDCGNGAGAAQTLDRCASSGIGSQLAMAAGGLSAVLLGILVSSIAVQAIGHRRIASDLMHVARVTMVGEQRICLVPGEGVALVAGILSPQIFCSADVLERLSADELRAVLLHERHHEISHAPTKLLILEALAPFVRHVAIGSAWLDHERAQIEIAADAHALRHGATRSVLARAILKLQEPTPRTSLAGFGSVSTRRIKVLLGDEVHEQGSPRSLLATIVVVVVGTWLCSGVLLA